jgi:hypothetical protein
MGVRDWFGKTATTQRPSAQNPPQNEPATAKEMYRHQAEGDGKAMNRMPPDQQAKVEAIRERLQKATQYWEPNTPAMSPASADSPASNEPMRQNMVSQDKAAPALSPTSAQAGTTATDKSVATATKETPAKRHEPVPRTLQTVTRRPASWER